MHEVRVTAPKGLGPEIARIAIEAGIPSVSVYDVYAYGPNEPKEIVSVEVATPVAKKFIDALVNSPHYDPARMTLTERTLLAILEHGHQDEITQPMIWSPPAVFDTLWQNSHITPAFTARCVIAPAILAYGMLHNSVILIVIALLFTQFLQPVLAVSFGCWAGDGKLVLQGAMAFGISTALAILSGVFVGLLSGGPMLFDDFKPMLVSLLISSAIGVVAGVSSADDVGRNYLVAVAAAAQYAIYPTWFGLSIVTGLPDTHTTWTRIGTFLFNVASISTVALVTYILLGMRRSGLQRYLGKR